MAADLAREFKVHRSVITRAVAQPLKVEKAVANQLVSAEAALRALPLAQQLRTLDLAEELRQISGHLASAGRYGAATAHRLSGIAHAKVAEIDDAEPTSDESFNALKHIAGLTRMANDAATIPLNLLAANKDLIRDAERADTPAKSLADFYGGAS